MRMTLLLSAALAEVLGVGAARAADTSDCDKQYEALLKTLQERGMPTAQREEYNFELLGAYENCKKGQPDWMGISNKINA